MRRVSAMIVSAMVAAPMVFMSAAFAQDGEYEPDRGPGTLPHCRVNDVPVTPWSLIDQIRNNSPDSALDDGDSAEEAPLYVVPSTNQRARVQLGVRYLAGGYYTLARQELTTAGYEVCVTAGVFSSDFSYATILVYDNEGRSTATTQGRPMLLLRRATVGALENGMALSAPHLNEDDILDMTVRAFADRANEVQAVVMAGTHRCNRSADSPDNGNTQECGGHYKISDMAHNIDSDFQAMHNGLRTVYPDSFNLSVHGMAGAGDEGFEVSRGNRTNAVHPADAVTRGHAAYAEALTTALEAGGVTPAEQTELNNLTSCSAYTNSETGVQVVSSNRHCGTNNDQGEVERANGDGARWLHIEISDLIRDNHRDVIQGMFAAIMDE